MKSYYQNVVLVDNEIVDDCGHHHQTPWVADKCKLPHRHSGNTGAAFTHTMVVFEDGGWSPLTLSAAAGGWIGNGCLYR